MRVIAGLARGTRLKALENDDIRPTTDKVKEAVFSMIHFELIGKSFLDLFAGSGQMAIEALSNGAKSATVVDANRKAISVIKENISKCKCEDSANVVYSKAEPFLCSTNEKFDIVYLDPPYFTDDMDKVLPLLANVCKETSTIICETTIEKDLPDTIAGFKITKQKRYGKIIITFYRSGE